MTRADGDRNTNWSLTLYATAVAAAGALVVLQSNSWSFITSNAVGIAFFFALVLFAEILYVPLPNGGGVSVSFAIIIACCAVYGPGAAALVSGFGLLFATFPSWKHQFIRGAFNFGQIALSSYLAGLVFQLLGGRFPGQAATRNVLALIIGSIAYFLVNTTLVMVVLSVNNRVPLRRVWAGSVRANLPSYMALVPLGILVALVYTSYGIPGSVLLLVPLLFARYSFLQSLHARRASVSVTQALAAALEAKDAYTKGHSDRVADYAVRVSREMNMASEDVEMIRWAAEMHDIGKIGVSESLLNKPGALTENELTQVRQHAVLGANMLQGIEFLHNVSSIIKYHHEWYDGSNGYPQELSGESIPVGARILMVCDSFDAMTSDRPYRKRIETAEAMRRLRDGSGTQFDPEVVRAFIRVMGHLGDEQC